jgi:hypothetical protein
MRVSVEAAVVGKGNSLKNNLRFWINTISVKKESEQNFRMYTVKKRFASLLRDIPAEDGKIANLFLQCSFVALLPSSVLLKFGLFSIPANKLKSML